MLAATVVKRATKTISPAGGVWERDTLALVPVGHAAATYDVSTRQHYWIAYGERADGALDQVDDFSGIPEGVETVDVVGAGGAGGGGGAGGAVVDGAVGGGFCCCRQG